MGLGLFRIQLTQRIGCLADSRPTHLGIGIRPGTTRAVERYRGMEEGIPVWLVDNVASGSNDASTLENLRELLVREGFRIVQRSSVPNEELPTPSMLDAAGVGLLVIFTGDGTINAQVACLAGWNGSVLVLPGGTKNLLYIRLHGDREIEEVIAAAARGQARRVRPKVIRSPAGDALAGLLAGPGTSWSDVREDMRDLSVAQMLEDAAGAIDKTLSAPGVKCHEPALGRDEGYPLLMLSPDAEGIEVSAFYAETVGEFLAQGWALIRRSFREGPHDRLGILPELNIESADGAPFGILVDGEPAEVPSPARFTLADCEVDLLATEADDL